MDSSGSVDDEIADYCWKRRWETLHRIRLSLLYHSKRERFFDHLDKVITATTAVAATAGFSMLYQIEKQSTGTGRLELGVTLATAILSVITIVYVPSAKAKAHGQLAAEMRRLLVECEAAGEHWGEAQCNLFGSRVLQAEVGETAQLGALVVQCENEIAVALGQPERVRKLGMWRSLWKHWFDFNVTGLRFLTEKEQQQYAIAAPVSKRPTDS